MASERDQLAAIEGRLRALEAIFEAMPNVATEEVFDRARNHMKNYKYRHPDDKAGVSLEERQERALNALDEIQRQMLDEG